MPKLLVIAADNLIMGNFAAHRKMSRKVGPLTRMNRNLSYNVIYVIYFTLPYNSVASLLI